MMQFVQAQLLMQSDNPIYAFLIVTVLGLMTRAVHSLWTRMMQRLDERAKALAEKATRIPLVSDESTATEHILRFTRNYTNSGNWDMADSILALILTNPGARHIHILADLELIMHKGEVMLDEKRDVRFRLKEVSMGKDNADKLESIVFELVSTRLTTNLLREYVSQQTRDYVAERDNELGNVQYYFDQCTLIGSDQIVFEAKRFHTTRTLDNLFHPQDDLIRHRVEFFMEHPEWYEERGLPYTLGLLLYGEPGCGKTSTIKAIAKRTGRHVFNINFASIRTKAQLKELFYSTRVSTTNDPYARSTKDLNIPINKRLYVIEDVDCLDGENGDVLKRRSDSDDAAAEKKPSDDPRDAVMKRMEEEKKALALDLSTILNVLDGTLETPGRIVIFTSNFPEKLDSALVRPGRVDLLIHYERATVDVIQRMYCCFYNKPTFPANTALPDRKWTPAEVAQIFFRNIDHPHQSIDDLNTLEPSVEFSFSQPDPVPSLSEALPTPSSGFFDYLHE